MSNPTPAPLAPAQVALVAEQAAHLAAASNIAVQYGDIELAKALTALYHVVTAPPTTIPNQCTRARGIARCTNSAPVGSVNCNQHP